MADVIINSGEVTKAQITAAGTNPIVINAPATLPNDSSGLFQNSTSTAITINTDASNVTNMSYMFYVSSVTTLNLGDKFDTSKVTNMEMMFGVSPITALNLGDKFDTSQVTNMSSMFAASRVTTLNLGDKFDTSRVTNMSNMFNGAESTTLNLGDKFDTSQVTNMSRMFDQLSATTINLGDKFDTSNVTDMSLMFFSSGATIINLGGKFNISSTTDVSRMFENSSAKLIKYEKDGHRIAQSSGFPTNLQTFNDVPNEPDFYYYAESSLFKKGLYSILKNPVTGAIEKVRITGDNVEHEEFELNNQILHDLIGEAKRENPGISFNNPVQVATTTGLTHFKPNNYYFNLTTGETLKASAAGDSVTVVTS